VQYQIIQAIQRDQIKDYNTVASEYANAGIALEPSKNWFIHREIYSHYPDGDLTEANRFNLKKAKEIFGALDPKVSFAKILKNNDVMLHTPSGMIPMEYLSSGFQASVLTLLAIIREVEFRLDQHAPQITEFDGIIIIDEVDVHLHPSWQARILDGLRQLLPKAQIILTTHSPHVIQNARAHEVLALENINGHIKKLELKTDQDGFQGWTIEEILRDAMGMLDVRPPKFTELYEAFDGAVQEENLSEAKRYFSELSAILHPTSDLRTILKLHLDTIVGVNA
jgi:hypothetical protein